MNERVTTFLQTGTIDNFNIRKVPYYTIKRLFDLFVSLIGLVAMLPVAIFVKIAYVLSGDFKSIFYRQQRIGMRYLEF